MEFESKPVEEHLEVPLADEGRWEEIVARWSRERGPSEARDSGNLCYVVSVCLSKGTPLPDAPLVELLALVRAQGDRVVGQEIHPLRRPDPRTFLGRGTCQQIATRATACDANLLVVDAELSPSQTRNLEEATGLAVCDREAVILNVFLRHARTQRARVQVEIAHLDYLRPRIRGVGLVMDQQAGGVMRGRGPGETASELLARQMDGRLAELRKTLARLLRAGDSQRSGRKDCGRISLVGYTNAGKTTLMNALTAAGLSARDAPFETLDTTSRCLTRHGGDVLLSDTVGFIRRLPERLLASFESTLSEVRESTLLALVVDASDPEWRLHLDTTHGLLAKLQADGIPRFYVFNKTDRLPRPPADEVLRGLLQGHDFMALSAHDPEAVARLRSALVGAARPPQSRTRIFVPYQATKAMALVYGKCRVTTAEAADGGLFFTLEADPLLVERIERALREERR